MALLRFAALAVIATGAAFSCAKAEQAGGSDQVTVVVANENRLRDTIDRIVIEEGVPSVSVAVTQGDRQIWAYASGLADKGAVVAAQPSTPYRLASVSKPITAVAIMLLVDRGVIDLDAPANNYLGEQKIIANVGDANDVTVRRLMSHRGGLPLHYNLIHENEDYQRRNLDETIALYGQAMLRPGATHRYSNIGYGVLERIIEIMSGKSYDTFLYDELFAPLGMDSAGVVTAPVHPEGAAIPYTRAGDRYPAYDIDTRGAGGVFMTAGDLVRFGRFFSDALDGRSPLLSQKAAAEMLETQAPTDRDRREWYVLGWVHELRGEDRQHDTIYHLGSTPGVRAELWIYPDQDLVIGTLVNEMNYKPLNRAREAVIGSVFPELAFIPFPEIRLAPTLQRRWAGAIDLGPDGRVPVSFDFADPTATIIKIGDETVDIISAGPLEDGLVEINTKSATLPTTDIQRQPYTLGFVLEPSGDRLEGYVAVEHVETRDRDSGNFSFSVMLSAVPAGQ